MTNPLDDTQPAPRTRKEMPLPNFVAGETLPCSTMTKLQEVTLRAEIGG